MVCMMVFSAIPIVLPALMKSDRNMRDFFPFNGRGIASAPFARSDAATICRRCSRRQKRGWQETDDYAVSGKLAMVWGVG